MTQETSEIFNLLQSIDDPEIPVINIVEMGIVRDIEINGNEVLVKITPTYSGCPAMKTIEDGIAAKLNSSGFKNVKVEKIYSPAWTTDWLSEQTRNKLKNYGIAPPRGKTEDEFYNDLNTKPVQCPYCNSKNTKLTSEFGSTACKSLHFCNECCQPFEYFKCI